MRSSGHFVARALFFWGDFSNSVSVLLRKGDATIQAAQNLAAGQWPTSVAVGDSAARTWSDAAFASVRQSFAPHSESKERWALHFTHSGGIEGEHRRFVAVASGD